jgi:hypothetical protein
MIRFSFNLIITVFLFAIPLNADVGIIPYRVNNPSEYFPEKTGMEYAKILSAGALIKKKLDITSPVDIEYDLKKIGVTAEGTITEDDLILIGKKLNLSYILLGTLSRIEGKYYSDSILFSVTSKRTVLKINVKDADIFKLAEKELKQAFFHYSPSAEGKVERNFDAVFIIDSSYSINPDFSSVKESIAEFASEIIDRQGYNSKFHIVPFSGNLKNEQAFSSGQSVSAIRQNLNKIKPSGSSNSKAFTDAFKYSVNSIGWRKNSSKIIVIISNSPLNKSTLAEKYARAASSKGIKVFTVSLGNLKKDESELLKNLSEITKGSHYYAAYHKKIFEASGSPIELFMQNGRLFESDENIVQWKEGLFEKSGTKYEKPGRGLDEIFYSDRKQKANPYNMTKLFSDTTRKNIINERELENNTPDILKNIASLKIVKPSGYSKSESDRIIGKALLSDGKISVWCYINEKKVYDYFSRKKDGVFYTIGTTVRDDPQSPYGLKFIPKIIDMPSTHIPDMMRASLYDIVKQREKFMNRGLYFPPVWFINVKIEEVESLSSGLDIREK